MMHLQDLYHENGSENISELRRYILAGLINTLIGFLVYACCVKFILLPFWAANFCAMIAGIISGFILARYYVFNVSRKNILQTFPKYILTIGLQFVVSTTLIAIFIQYGLNDILSYIASLPIIILLSFVLQKVWVFQSYIENQ